VIGSIELVITTTNNLGCPAGADTLVVTYHMPPMVDAGASVVLCDGIEDVQLNAVVQYQSSMQWFTTGTGTFSPSDDVANAVYTPSANDSIVGGVHLILTAFGTSPCGNATDSLFVDIGPTRIADAGTDASVCATGDPLQLTGTITGVSGGAWSTTGTGTFLPNAQTLNASYVPSATDLVFPQLQFILATTGNQGCPAHTDTMVVFLQQPPTADAGPDLNTCDPSQGIALNGATSGASGLVWSTTGSGVFLPDDDVLDPIYQPGPTDSLMQQVVLVLSTTGNGNCPAAIDTTVLSFVNPLDPDFTWSNACVGSATQFVDASTISSGAIIAWNWDLGNGTMASGQQVSTTYDLPGTYTVSLTVVAQNGCSATIELPVTMVVSPVAGFGYTGDPMTGLPIAFSDSSQGAASWHYDFGDGFGASLDQNPIYTYPEPGQFIVVQTVTNAAGCTDSDSLLILIGQSDILPPKLPNAFTPNGDGVNDVFYVRGGPFVTIDLQIYNGWGELIFQTTDPLFGWDGTYKGEPEINGVYTYTVKATTVDGVEHDRPGKVTLIR
jgi:gliding motility-associated-like protein